MKKNKNIGTTVPYETMAIGLIAGIGGATAAKFVNAKLIPTDTTEWSDPAKMEKLSYLHTPIGITAIKALVGIGFTYLGVSEDLGGEQVQTAATGFGLGMVAEAVSSYITYAHTEANTDPSTLMLSSVGSAVPYRDAYFEDVIPYEPTYSPAVPVVKAVESLA